MKAMSLFIISAFIFLVACQEEEAYPPQVRTAGVSSVTYFSASIGGEILDDGGAAITSVGLIIADNPEFSSSRNLAGHYSGSSFSASVTGLEPNLTYYAKAWAKNEAGTGHGEATSFTTIDSPATAPTVSKVEVTAITATSATFTATVNPNGAETSVVFQYTLDNNKTDVAYGTKLSGRQEIQVTLEVPSLKTFADYSVKAKATNSAGTADSPLSTAFSTLRLSAGTVTDIDGNVYNTVVIGEQVWLVENLKVTHYRNGDPIPNVTDRQAWTEATTGAYCWYDNDQSHKADYGALYNQYATVDPRGLAPEGWHVPSDGEWMELRAYIRDNYSVTYVGVALKERGTLHWVGQNEGTDLAGFSARPGGIRGNSATEQGVFMDFGTVACFWSTTMATSETSSWMPMIMNDNGNLYFASNGNHDGASIRCIKNK